MGMSDEPAGIISSIVMGAALGFVSFFLMRGFNVDLLGSRFAMDELVVLGAIIGVATHVFGKIRH